MIGSKDHNKNSSITEKDKKNFTQEDWDELNKCGYGQEWLGRDQDLTASGIDEYNKIPKN